MKIALRLIGGPHHNQTICLPQGISQHKVFDPDCKAPDPASIAATHLIRQGLYVSRPHRPRALYWQGWLP